VHTEPRNLLTAADALAVRLQQSLPEQKAAIEQRRAAFAARMKGQISQWEARAAPLRGRQVAAQHSSFGYLWKWLGVTQVADLEPKPGMAPTPGHLQRLLDGLKGKPPMAVVISSYQDARPGRWLSGQLGAVTGGRAADATAGGPGNPVGSPMGSATVNPATSATPLLVLPATVAEDADGEALIRWFDTLLSALLAAPALAPAAPR
jgi:zinc/manganese transport system substrate-binding protein